MLATLLMLSTVLIVAILLIRYPTDLGVGWLEVVAATLADAGVALVFGSVALAVGASTGRRAVALGAAVAVAVVTYLIDSMSAVADVLRPWRWVSPFWWSGGRDPVVNGFSSPWLLLLPAAAVACTAVGAWAMNRRDLRAAT